MATLSRPGFVDRIVSLVVSDSTATGAFEVLRVGRWHLRLGREVEVLVNSLLSAGRDEVMWMHKKNPLPVSAFIG